MADLAFSVVGFGAFGMAQQKGVPSLSAERVIRAYEFEFYNENFSNGLIHDGVFYPAKKGGCCLAKPGQVQQVLRPYRGYYFNVATQDADLCDMLDNLPGFFTLWNMSEVIELLNQMIATDEQSSLVGRMKLQSCACRILAILSRYRKNPRAGEGSVYQNRKTLLMADKYIREHLAEEISLAELARICNMDQTYFHKLYTAAFGKTPVQRLLGFRIAAAKTGLLENKVTMAELATRCGFSSQAYFSYKFKQATGMTPLQFRKKTLEGRKN